MALRIYNSLSHSKEDFPPVTAHPQVGMYTCGPTVYNYAHIGNLLAYTISDLVRRTLEYLGYQVKQVINITDVDDKTIRDSHKTGADFKTFVRQYEQAFLEDIAKLNIKPPTVLPRATEHIPEMIRLIDQLLEKGLAYRADDGVYFSIKKFPAYGQLSRLSPSKEMYSRAWSRVRTDEYDKENIHDFALWKFSVPEDREIAWDAPFGKGRPGWHIECSAMSMKYLGPTFDIHTGGHDLIFPHHENEIAQSVSVTGKPFVHFWLHSAFLRVNNEKMSKSLGNVYNLRDIEARNFTPLAYRYWLLTAHYRTTVNFTWEAIASAQQALNNLGKLIIGQDHLPKSLPHLQRIQALKIDFRSALEDDFNLPRALAITWSVAKDNDLSVSEKRELILDFDRVLGLDLASYQSEKIDSALEIKTLPPKIQELVEKREAARQNNDWLLADNIREQLGQSGYKVKDTPVGPEISLYTDN